MPENAFEERGQEVEEALKSLRAAERESEELAKAIEADQRETEDKLDAVLRRLHKLDEAS